MEHAVTLCTAAFASSTQQTSKELSTADCFDLHFLAQKGEPEEGRIVSQSRVSISQEAKASTLRTLCTEHACGCQALHCTSTPHSARCEITHDGHDVLPLGAQAQQLFS